MSLLQTKKQRQRAELEALVAQYDGPITRKNERRVTVCRICAARYFVPVERALTLKLYCRRCGSEQVLIEW
jgi:hypothetical protein